MKGDVCKGAPNIWGGFQAIESTLSDPFMRCLYFLERIAEPPQQASTCSQTLCLEQTSAKASKSSYAPSTVDPDVALTKNGTLPFALTLSKALSNSSGIIRPPESVSTFTTLSTPKPNQLAPFTML